MLSAEFLQSRLPIRGLGEPFYFHPTIGSTNERASQLADQGSPHGTLIVAEEQTAGRGRTGRRWFTRQGTGLALSLVLRPHDLEQGMLCGLTVLGALAVVESIDDLGGEAWIKWPNDVLLEGRKVAGVLVEASWMGDVLEHVVLGIGVNVRMQSVPEDRLLDYPAISLETVLGEGVDRSELLLAIIDRVGWWYPKMGDKTLLTAWNRRLAFRGQEVQVVTTQGEFQGLVEGVTLGGQLRLVSRET
jgi:BirA family biotin operon repressor/biotin-[acetyl-CoA-carboxylase] ligase